MNTSLTVWSPVKKIQNLPKTELAPAGRERRLRNLKIPPFDFRLIFGARP